jgi:transcriptional regulator with XRE-family HTH domain
MDTVDIIFNLLKEQGKTQQELANTIGVSKYKISEWKARKTASYMKHLDAISSYFGVTTDYLLGNEQKEKPATDSDRLTEEEKKIIDLLRKVPEEDRKMLVGMIEGALRSRGLLK